MILNGAIKASTVPDKNQSQAAPPTDVTVGELRNATRCTVPVDIYYVVTP